MKVRDAMTITLVEVSASDTCQHAAQLMRDHNVGMLVVTKPGRVLEGVLTDRDLVVRCLVLGGDPAQHTVGDYMDAHPTAVDADVELEKAVEIMRNGDLRRLPVTLAGARVIGVLSLDDVALDIKHYLDAFLSVSGHYAHKAR